MLIQKNGSDTAIIILPEIYGINQHILNVGEKLSKRRYDVIIPNLLKGRTMFSYAQEAMAYDYFMHEIGFAAAMTQVKQLLSEVRLNYKKVYVLGYSIGATLAWLCSETGLCDLVIGFYGSRIRDNLAVVPRCPTLLFFPNEENSFVVDDLLAKLSKINNLTVRKLRGKHGFADQFSKNYDKSSAFIANKEIFLFLKSLSV